MSEQIRVVLVGSFRIGRLASSYQRAFESLGHEVICFDVNTHIQKLDWWLRSRIGHRITINSLHARRFGSRLYNREIYNFTKRICPDLVLIFNGPFLMPETAYRIRDLGVKVALFHADNPFPPHYNSRPETLLLAKACDICLLWSTLLVADLRKIGITAEYLPFGWDNQLMPFQGFDHRMDFDVTFVGGWDPQRELLLEEIAEHFDLKIWGPEYWGTRTRRNSKVRQCWQGRELHGSECSKVFASSRINLNILRDQHYSDGKPNGVIMRTFEVPGAGGFLLSTRSNDAVRCFPEDVAAGYYDSDTDCIEKIDYYLRHNSERIDTLCQAHYLVDANHHYEHRVKDILGLTLYR